MTQQTYPFHDASATAPSQQPMRIIRSAIFADFDNAFISLDKVDPELALKFANLPARWLTWLRGQAPNYLPMPGPFHRRLLVRRCYLNPGRFNRHRAELVKAGFEVIDCPSMTYAEKNSADIKIVIDALDALHYDPPIEEFIVLSSDSDFTPLFQRLRRSDRHSILVATGQTSPAIRAACDLFLDAGTFEEHLRSNASIRVNAPLPTAVAGDVRTSDPAEPSPPATGDPANDFSSRMVEYLKNLLAQRDRPLSLAHAGTLVRRAFPDDFAKERHAGMKLTDMIAAANDPHLEIIANGVTLYLSSSRDRVSIQTRE